MMIKVLEKNHLELRSFEAAFSLEKQIVVGDFTAEERTPGHYIDYLDSTISYVTLCAKRDVNLTLWESHTLLEHCQDNFILNVHLKLSFDDLASCIETKQLESWCARNHIILHKARDEAHLTYYFNLFDTHQITGELMISPVLYFDKNPLFTLQADGDVVSQLLKTKPIVLEVKKNQIICFDKYHYQMAYCPDFNFIRVHDVHRSD
ncbi:hypothetical protein LEAN103870_11400 [Legionella anisa]|nr:hypothetical protein [Legionella anisa]MDW9132333.1 hypothetical protein [Legionella pneumophila]KTC66945.1 hypothetical protein Lani_3290 [Legionella anisa]MBN5934216.1 hypothetical protein [Legionella anisa]MCW8426302.1 hypothetical protein [Legionella anisa]MCW8447962.1 hypothetical protein [Legionella anisa]